ncbi:MAG: RdgB/HAM1 family non-canonical purine NTP pyrophosphatase [Clostridia bacterium]|nr:RdgB/HAM1 family non-canonical purine NTP pyrophosphatase [Clostridia bacterium]
MKLILATNNAHKVREFREILGDFFSETVTLKEAGITHETVEDGTTFKENALKKAREITEITGCAAIADDSGLCVEALNGMPGVFSARYASVDDNNASDQANRDLLLKNMEGIKDRRAYFACAIALTMPDGTSYQTEGRFYGEIGYEEKGENGFGYDSLFFVPEYNMTSAQMTPEQKNSMSHRGKALRELVKML